MDMATGRQIEAADSGCLIHTPYLKGPLGPHYWGGAKGGGKNQKSEEKYVRNYHETDA